MTRKRSNDFSAARESLKDIGKGLGTVFETMTKLIEEAADDDRAGRPRQRVKSSFDLRVGTLDELSAAKRRPSPVRPKPSPTPPKPLGLEQHETATGLLIIITLGQVAAADITIRGEDGSIVFQAPGWQHRIPAASDLDITGAQRTERNGYLSVEFKRLGATGSTSEEN